jgi:hypothetical protein
MKMTILIGVQLFVIGIFLLLGWAVRYKKVYGLISGYISRPAKEQEELVKNGYPQKMGGLLILTAVGMLILLPLAFTSFTYVMEVQFGFMLIFLMGGMIYLSKYEIPSKRKRSYWISSILMIVVFGVIGGAHYCRLPKE